MCSRECSIDEFRIYFPWYDYVLFIFLLKIKREVEFMFSNQPNFI